MKPKNVQLSLGRLKYKRKIEIGEKKSGKFEIKQVKHGNYYLMVPCDLVVSIFCSLQARKEMESC